MKIGLIRHFPVNHAFLKGLVSQSQVLEWFAQYNAAGVQQLPVAVGGNWQKCYSSQLARARQTAAAIYPGEVTCTDLLNEPFPDPVFKRNIKLPFLAWAMLLRTALVYNHATQSQSLATIKNRIQTLLPELISHGGANVLVVSHAFTMEILSRFLIAEGFSGKKLKRPEHGVLYVYEKQVPTCHSLESQHFPAATNSINF